MRACRWKAWILVAACTPWLAAAPRHADAASERFTSTHYALSTDLGEDFATDALAMLEAAWPQLRAWFGASPALLRGQRLEVYVFAKRRDWILHCWKKTGNQVGATWAGSYDPVDKSISMYRQASAPYTRHLLLHEAVHQFHHLASGASKMPKARWYKEGVAEYLAQHTWDGETLRLGIVPPLAHASHAHRASEIMGGEPYYLYSVMTPGTGATTYPEMWAFVRYMDTGDDPKLREAWKQIRPKLDAGTFDLRKEMHRFGDLEGVKKKMLAWLERQVSPLASLWGSWDALAPRAISGEAKGVALAHLRAPTDEISATLSGMRGPGCRAGLVLHYGGPDDFTVAWLWGRGGWSIDQRKDGAWHNRQTGRRRFALDKPLRMTARRAGGHVAWLVEGKRVTSVQVRRGAMGVGVQDATARFLDLAWR